MVVAAVVGIVILAMVNQGSLALLEAIALRVDLQAVQMVVVVILIQLVLVAVEA